MSKRQNSERLVTVLESLSDITLTVVADFLSSEGGGGLPVVLALAQVGVTVFPVGVVGEDEAGQRILHVLQEHRISHSAVSRIKKYATPSEAGAEQIHGEHPALLNLIEHARKFATASDGMYVCDCGIGAASPRLLNFIKSNRCLKEKTLAARSRERIAEFEQLTAAIATEAELERAIGIEIGGDAAKLAAAAEGFVQEMRLESFLAVGKAQGWSVSGDHKPQRIALTNSAAESADILGALFAAALAAGAEAAEAGLAASEALRFLHEHEGGKRTSHEELLNFVAGQKTASRAR